jgi:hypothetical protein
MKKKSLFQSYKIYKTFINLKEVITEFNLLINHKIL